MRNINIRKIKLIKSKDSNKKKILVFPKSGGNEDLIETYHNQKSLLWAFDYSQLSRPYD